MCRKITSVISPTLQLADAQFLIMQPFLAHLEKQQILLQINHTHCVGPAYQNICYSEASVWPWSLLFLNYFAEMFQVS